MPDNQNYSSTNAPEPALAEKYAMAIAEAGYPDSVVMFGTKPALIGGRVPIEVMYQAFLTVRRVECCFTCWDERRHTRPSPPIDDCPHGRTSFGKFPQEGPS